MPFSSALRFSAIEFKDSGAWLLGAPEALLAKGTAERERAAELAALGLRTMVLAHASAVVRNEKDEMCIRDRHNGFFSKDAHTVGSPLRLDPETHR